MVNIYRHAYDLGSLNRNRYIAVIRSVYIDDYRLPQSNIEIFLTPDDALALAEAVREHPTNLLTVRDVVHPATWYIQITGWRMIWHKEGASRTDCLWESDWPEIFAAELERAVFSEGRRWKTSRPLL